MNRREFIAAIAALPLAPKAIEAVAKLNPWGMNPAGIYLRTYCFGIDGRVWRKMQLQILEGSKTAFEEWADLEESS